MPKLNQRGVIHLLVPIILLIGLVVGVYLVTSGNPLKLFSRATVSPPVGPETSFTLVGPDVCTGGWSCIFKGKPQLQEKFEVKVYARSDIETANLFTAKMTFPKDLVEVTGIKEEADFIQNWVEDYYDNSEGTIDLVGGVTAPGYKTQQRGQSALMATITFKAKALGKGAVSFTDSSAIYSNLNNINILTTTRGYDVSIEVKSSPVPISAPVSPSPSPFPSPISFVCTACAADVVKDTQNIVNARDYAVLSTCTGKKPTDTIPGGVSCAPADINKDGNIDETDYSCLKSVYLQSCVVPSGNKGDGNKDGKINLVDMSILHSSFPPAKGSGNPNYKASVDMNDDGLILSNDFLAHRELLIRLGVVRRR